MSHDLAALARNAHRKSLERESEAAQHRSLRDGYIRSLRKADPDRWSYGRIAREVGCSPQLVAYIIKGR